MDTPGARPADVADVETEHGGCVVVVVVVGILAMVFFLF
jgi:hypothetical protein